MLVNHYATTGNLDLGTTQMMFGAMNHATNTSRFDGDLASFVILNTVVPIADAVQLHQPKAFGETINTPDSWFVDWEDLINTQSGGLETNIYPIVLNGTNDPVGTHTYTLELGNTSRNYHRPLVGWVDYFDMWLLIHLKEQTILFHNKTLLRGLLNQIMVIDTEVIIHPIIMII